MAGRPSKYTPERVQRIIKALEGGNTRRASCSAGGIDEETFARWLKSHADFGDSVREAELKAELFHVQQLYIAGDWRASLAWLERRRHQDWGKLARVDVTSNGERISFTINVGGSSDASDSDTD